VQPGSSAASKNQFWHGCPLSVHCWTLAPLDVEALVISTAELPPETLDLII